MSMHTVIFSNRRLSVLAQWQDVLDAEGYPLRLSADADFLALQGVLPMALRDVSIGVEIYHDDPVEASEAMGLPPQPFHHALSLRWLGSRFDETEAALMLAAAYARATGGSVFDAESGKMLTADAACAAAAEFTEQRPDMEREMAEAWEKIKVKLGLPDDAKLM